MIGLVIKDFLILKKQLLLFLFIFVLYFFIGSVTDNTTFFGGFMLVFGALLVINCFSYDDQAHFNSYALAMPISRRDLVASKYLVGLSLLLLGGILCFFYLGPLSLLSGSTLTAESLYTVAAMGMGSLFFLSLMFPLVIKLGTEKARLFLVLIFLLPTMAVILIDKTGLIDLKFLICFIKQYANLLILAAFASLLVLYGISYLLSLYIIKGKEY